MQVKQIFWRVLVLAVTFNCAFEVHAQQATVITSDEFEFIWPIPSTWEKTQSFTKAQYAIKPRNSISMGCTLLVFRTSKTTLESLLKNYSSNPTVLFNGIKGRFPDATFISSKITKLGSLDAIQTEAFYELKNLDSAIKAYGCLIVTIRHGMVYSINFECPPDEVKEGQIQMARILAAFSFLK